MENTQERAENQTKEIQVEKETREEMLSRHRKEISELQNKEIALKKAAAKGSKDEQKAKKKQVEEQISQLTTELKEKQVFGGPVDLKEMIRELEKKRIREEIMAEEIALQRALEAEVRREMMAMQRERVASSSMSLGLPLNHVNRFESGIPYGDPVVPLDRRSPIYFPEQYGGTGSRLETGVFEAPFQRSPNFQEFTKSPQRENRKMGVIGLGIPNDATISRSKRKPPPPPPPPPSAPVCRVKWKCKVCKISAPSKSGLNDHFAGKKHQAKVAAQNTGVGATQKKPTSSASVSIGSKSDDAKTKVCKISATGLNDHFAGKKHQAKVAVQNTGVGGTQKKPTSSESVSIGSKSDDARTKGEDKSDKFPFWCKVCGVRASTIEVMNAHIAGKKHLEKLLELKRES